MSDHGGRLGYRPALDGFRGLAVLAVLVFHAGFGWAPGGFLGVTAFFVLSGFLITSLLLVERSATGRIDLRAFWGRRARRLVPAALVLLALTVVYAAAADTTGAVVGDGIAAAGWVANWRFVFADQSYEALFADPSPFQHMWSLAIEEQFYLVLPLAAAVLLRRRRAFAIGALVVAAASTAAAALLHDGGAAGRAYYGTDARVAEPLVGVLLALALVKSGGLKQFGRRGRATLDVLAAVGIVGLGLLIATVHDDTDALYRGGFLLTALLAATVVAAGTQPETLTARGLAAPPLVLLGRVSYGVYLFHWPVFLWLDAERTGLHEAPLFAVRCAITLALAVTSYVLLERPVRAGRIRGRVGVVGWANATVGLLAALMVASSVAPASNDSSLFASGDEELAAPPVTTPPDRLAAPPSTSSPIASTASTAAPRAGKGAKSKTAAGKAPGSTTPAPGSPTPSEGGDNPFYGTGPAPSAPPTTAPEAPGPPKLRVAVVGDSLARNLAVGLDAWAQGRNDVVVYDMARGGCPISRGGTRRLERDNDYSINEWCQWWGDPESEPHKNLVAFDPDVVISQDGINEVPDRKLPEWGNYRWLGDPRFDRWLTNEYTAAFGAFRATGAVVIALNAVCADWPNLRHGWSRYAQYNEGARRSAHLNSLMDVHAAQGTWIGDLNSRLCPNDRFTNDVEGVEDARPDGYHLTKEASEALAANWLGPLVLQVPPKPR